MQETKSLPRGKLGIENAVPIGQRTPKVQSFEDFQYGGQDGGPGFQIAPVPSVFVLGRRDSARQVSPVKRYPIPTKTHVGST